MKDVVILVPGIMGSVLQKDGQDIWNVSLPAVWGATREILCQHSLLEELIVKEDDPERDYLDDGIRATGLIPGAMLVPGYIKIYSGYFYLRNQLIKNFDVTFGANYFEFAYDWRRDNRAAARLLKKLIDQNLPKWQEKNPGAKVILIAHSMGGLVSRYYLEHLEGWKDCKALITLGSPYRGSVKILNFLANGYLKKPLPTLANVIRSFTSSYQLLSMYPVVNVDGKWQSVSETIGIPGVDLERARQAQKFLQLINLDENLNYINSYQFKPIIGVGQQSTFQSAKLSNGKLEVDTELPVNPRTKEPLDNGYATGDDTVPFLSAIPVDLSNELQEAPFIESHGALQSNVQVWNLLKHYLTRLQDTMQDFQKPHTIQSATQTAGISLSFDDLYLPDEEVTLDAEIMNVDSKTLERTRSFGGLRASITPVSGQGEDLKPSIFQFEQQGDNCYRLNLEPNIFPSGLYRLEVETNRLHRQAPKTIHSLFGIAE